MYDGGKDSASFGGKLMNNAADNFKITYTLYVIAYATPKTSLTRLSR